jgi:hypothetical protein
MMAKLANKGELLKFMGDKLRENGHSAVVEDEDRQRIASILIDGSSEESDKRNLDVMVDVVGFSPSTAALALYVLQQFAPSGGRGHRQSMRGVRLCL